MIYCSFVGIGAAVRKFRQHPDAYTVKILLITLPITFEGYRKL
jgi:hypothetical protein